jgi:hypothetical protein
MVTFSVSDVQTLGEALPSESLVSSLWRRTQAPIEAGACNAANLVRAEFPRWAGEHDGLHGLVAAAHLAFDQHYPLVLSPDDIWLCIAQGFGIHVNDHAESLRSRIVPGSQSKEKIRVRRDHFVKGSPDNDWPGCFSEFSDGIAAHVGKRRDLLVASFSTTGPVEKAASEVALMSALQSYFDFVVETLCGVPRITLLGTPEDWKSVRRRASVLSEFDLGWWCRALEPVLDQFVRASTGSVDVEFWRSLYKLRGGSGGPWVTGWINVLFPYLEEDGHRQRNPNVEDWSKVLGPRHHEFPSGLSCVGFSWEYLSTKIAMEFLGGFVGVSQDAATLALRPVVGWAVREAG